MSTFRRPLSEAEKYLAAPADDGDERRKKIERMKEVRRRLTKGKDDRARNKWKVRGDHGINPEAFGGHELQKKKNINTIFR